MSKKIVISIGHGTSIHGGYDPGALSKDGRYEEHKIAAEIGKYAAEYLGCKLINYDGSMSLTDRIKDMFKTAGGKFIAPQMLEGLVCNDPMVSQAVAIGNERKYVSMLIVPAFEELEKWAKEKGIKYKTIDDLLSEPEVQKLYRQVIDLHTGKLARYEQIKRFTLLPHAFTVEQGHLTSTMKIRRNVISNLYAEVIEAMYD